MNFKERGQSNTLREEEKSIYFFDCYSNDITVRGQPKSGMYVTETLRHNDSSHLHDDEGKEGETRGRVK